MAKKTLLVIHPGEFLTEALKELALLFGQAFDQPPQYWLNLQADHDLKTARAAMGARLRSIHAVTHA
jgi:plasmid maintenance system antidote protein VapI